MTATSSFSFAPLHRLNAMKEISAAFISNDKGEIMAREVHEKYSDAELRQIALRILTIFQDQDFPRISEYQVVYENFCIWLRSFGSQGSYTLIVFIEHGADLSLLRQPINLAVLNMEKTMQLLQAEQEKEAMQSKMAKAARLAEQAMFLDTSKDTNGVFEKLNLLAYYYFGLVCTEMLQHICRDLNYGLPLTKQEELEAIIVHCGQLLVSPEKKAAFLSQADDLVQTLMLTSLKS